MKVVDQRMSLHYDVRYWYKVLRRCVGVAESKVLSERHLETASRTQPQAFFNDPPRLSSILIMSKLYLCDMELC